jgi:hypothetical protein
MNTSEPTPTESAFRPGNNPCFGSDAKAAALNVVADDENSYLLPYAQFLYAEMISNPALEGVPDAPPQKMLIRFALAEVVVLGSGLASVERDLQRYELKFIKSADRRFAAMASTHIAAVTITLTKEEL